MNGKKKIKSKTHKILQTNHLVYFGNIHQTKNPLHCGMTKIKKNTPKTLTPDCVSFLCLQIQLKENCSPTRISH